MSLSNSSSFEANESQPKLATPRSGKYLRTQVQYQLHNLNSVTSSGNKNPMVLSSPTPISRQPLNFRHATNSIFPSTLKSITSSVVSETRVPFSFSVAAASTTASQLSTLTIAGPVFSSQHPRATWQRLEANSMASPRQSDQTTHSKKNHSRSPQRQRQLEGSGGAMPKSSTAARECVVEARRIVQHFVSGTCSEADFCSVIERSSGHERWALLRVLKDMLGNAANSEEHCETMLLVCGHVASISNESLTNLRIFAGRVSKNHVTLLGEFLCDRLFLFFAGNLIGAYSDMFFRFVSLCYIHSVQVFCLNSIFFSRAGTAALIAVCWNALQRVFKFSGAFSCSNTWIYIRKYNSVQLQISILYDCWPIAPSVCSRH